LANETLRKISGGQLQVLITREQAGSDQQIVIRADDARSDGDPLYAEFLSGSEKFRTSVALAAAIGQYTAGRERVNSLIIDEGFGSLDTAGRLDMIDELHRLAEVMERIIVVSHQDDFHDRTIFPTGYLLRKGADGGTEVERLV
jgi:exonuclease SbcC